MQPSDLQPVLPNTIGAYGPWAAGLVSDQPGSLSFRRTNFSDLAAWRSHARQRFFDRIAQPDTGPEPQVQMLGRSTYDGLSIEELSWQLPYGPPTRALFLKPQGVQGKLPAILALHDHDGNKFFGRAKITQTDPQRHPLMVEHQERIYGGRAWANAIAKRGYAVLVPDAFAFASRRVRLADVPEELRNGLDDPDPSIPDQIQAYNEWAAAHESIMAKALFSAGTTWPGVFLAEDQRALDVLCARPDVDAGRVGCGGLSGGGLRTVFLAGADERVRCAVCAGMMTTWRDYLLNKCHRHTWMCYVPLLARELDYPEILGLRAPLPTLVLNNVEDPLFSLSEMQRADAILSEIFAKAEAPTHYHCSFYPGPHKFDKPMQTEAFDWFDRWLSASERP